MAGTKQFSKALLTPIQLKFCREYATDGKGKEAAIRAGYPADDAKHIASALIQDPRIIKRVEQCIEEQLSQIDVSRNRIAQEFARIAFSDIRDFYDENGLMLPVEKLPLNAARVVQAIEVEEIYEGFGPNRRPIGYTKRVKLWDKKAALDSLCKMLGFNEPDKLQIGQVGTLPKELTLDQLKALAAGQPIDLPGGNIQVSDSDEG
jgi:phage terminase small subunit